MFTRSLLAVFANALFVAAAINPATSKGNFGPFTPAKAPSRQATGAPTSVSAQQASAIAQACTNWIADTGKVSNFQNIGKGTPAGTQFTSAANVAFQAETDELIWKGQLDAIIGNDPLVSIANLTLTDGSFQSVLDNLQIMATQGKNLQNLIDTINNVRCTQILPSIDQYCITGARITGQTNFPTAAIRPTACAAILAADQNPNDYPNLPGLPGATNTQPTGTGAGTGTNTGNGAASSTTTAPKSGTTSTQGGRNNNNPASNILSTLNNIGSQFTSFIPGLGKFTNSKNSLFRRGGAKFLYRV